MHRGIKHLRTTALSKRIKAAGIAAANKMGTDVKQIQPLDAHVKDIVPKLTYSLHKGQAGRIGIIGGSKEYTGAPYFAAFTALRLGADLSHVFCTESAGVPIKTYSPDLIVHPMLDAEDAVDQMKYWLPRIHALVIGPGLGRDKTILKNVKEIINIIKAEEKPVVLDGDALFLISQEPQLIANYHQAVLTPNVIEYQRIYKAVIGKSVDDTNREAELIKLSKTLGGVTIVGKGELDIITNGEFVTVVTEKGSPRRCGGQGDILAGAIGIFLHWAYSNSSLSIPVTMLGSYAGCALVKKLNKLTFDSFKIEQPGDTGRSMVTKDMIENLSTAFYHLTK